MDSRLIPPGEYDPRDTTPLPPRGRQTPLEATQRDWEHQSAAEALLHAIDAWQAPE
jgi:hypothetical protein